MAMKDVLQSGRKLKRPHLRQWFYNKKGDDTYRQTPIPKKKFPLLLKASPSVKKTYYIAYKGKEYSIDEFTRKYPRLVRPKKR